MRNITHLNRKPYLIKPLIIILSALLLLYGLLTHPSFSQAAEENSFATVVNPVRGSQFWEDKDQTPSTVVRGQMELSRQTGLPFTWLVRYDALNDREVLQLLNSSPANNEKGLFLEIIPMLATNAGVNYRHSGAWHLAESVFLIGYEPAVREKLIDEAFSEFRTVFGHYPRSVGAWWIDSYSISYMQQKYGIQAVLIVADQFSTDNYQIWGQYYGTPFYPDRTNALLPAQSLDRKIPVVVSQWAVRDPVNGHGEGVHETTFSVQVNDYQDFHNLDINYFSRLIDIYTRPGMNKFGHITIGLENTYSWEKYSREFDLQIKELQRRQKQEGLKVVSMSDFAGWYKNTFPTISPQHLIFAPDPLGTDKKTIWFMSPFYRMGWFYTGEESAIRDLRRYLPGNIEPCYQGACDHLNFATFPTPVLDDIRYGDIWVLDKGEINNFRTGKTEGNYYFSYQDSLNFQRKVVFSDRTLAINDEVFEPQGLIQKAITHREYQQNKDMQINPDPVSYLRKYSDLLADAFFYLAFLLLALAAPGYLLIRKIKTGFPLQKLFLSISAGLAIFTLVSYLGTLIGITWFAALYITASAVAWLALRVYKDLTDIKLTKVKAGSVMLVLLILSGVLFQSLSMFRSGWTYDFGIGFWGPTGHDGIWHQTLSGQLMQNTPPQNPGFAGTQLENYHYFYNLLIAETSRLTHISIPDLIYRFYPVAFSLLLGLGTFILAFKLFKNRSAAAASVFFVYFGSSFGWIVEMIKGGFWGGESSFWANQPVSMNLNPPYAVSLILLIAGVLLLINYQKTKNLFSASVFIIIVGTLIEFKVYAGVIALAALGFLTTEAILVKKDFSLLKLLIPSGLLSLLVFLPNNANSAGLIEWAPWWFINSMMEFTDRVGWVRIVQARYAYEQTGNWPKLVLVQLVSLGIFIVGNMGTRILALPVTFKIWKKELFSLGNYCFIFWMALLSFILPLLFVQKGNAWNTIQFFYYFLYFASLFAGLGVYHLLRMKSLWIKLIVVLVLLVTPISSYATFRSGLGQLPPSRLTYPEYEALEFLKDEPDGVVVTHPFNKDLRKQFENPYPLVVYETTSYVSAYSGKNVYLEDEMQQQIFGNDYQLRLIALGHLFYDKDFDWSKNFLKQNMISYIYLPKVFGVDLDEKNLELQNIFENSEVVIYKVI